VRAEVDKERAKQLAEDHADWFFSSLRKVYVEAMIHGYGHGFEDATKAKEANK
jgi:hypothetical protein